MPWKVVVFAAIRLDDPLTSPVNASMFLPPSGVSAAAEEALDDSVARHMTSLPDPASAVFGRGSAYDAAPDSVDSGEQFGDVVPIDP
jgi:hypothetical protein